MSVYVMGLIIIIIIYIYIYYIYTCFESTRWNDGYALNITSGNATNKSHVSERWPGSAASQRGTAMMASHVQYHSSLSENVGKTQLGFLKNSTARHTIHLPISHVLPNQTNWQRKKSLIGTNRYRWLSLWSQYMRLFVAIRSPYSPKKMPATSKIESL